MQNRKPLNNNNIPIRTDRSMTPSKQQITKSKYPQLNNLGKHTIPQYIPANFNQLPNRYNSPMPYMPQANNQYLQNNKVPNFQQNENQNVRRLNNHSVNQYPFPQQMQQTMQRQQREIPLQKIQQQKVVQTIPKQMPIPLSDNEAQKVFHQINGIKKQDKTQQCMVCTNDKVIQFNPSQKCKHKQEICTDCIVTYIQSQINQKGLYKNINCLYDKCTELVDIETFKPMMDKRYKEIQSNLEIKSFLEQQEDFRWCSNPKGCGSGQFIENYQNLSGYYCCSECKIELCFHHKIPYHFKFTCKEYNLEVEKNDVLKSENYMLLNTKMCPGCKSKIEKSEGCCVMRCCQYGTHDCQDTIKRFGKCDHGGQAFCGTMFCWHCLSIFNGENRTCQKSCKYYTE